MRFIDVGQDLDEKDTSQSSYRLILIDTYNPSAFKQIPIAEDEIGVGDWGVDDEYFFPVIQFYFHHDQAFSAIYCLSAKNFAVSEVYHVPGVQQGIKPKLSPDGKYIAFASDVDNLKWGDFQSLILFQLKTGTTRRLTHILYVDDIAWAVGSKNILFLARKDGLDQIYKTDLEGRIHSVTHDLRNHFNLSASPNHKIVSYQTLDGYGRNDIRILSVGPDERERLVSVLSDPHTQFLMGTFKNVSWISYDGLHINGFLFLPPNFDSTKKYPMFVDVHGGGPSSPLTLMNLFTLSGDPPLGYQAIADEGYIVFVPDYRSSGEYGQGVAQARYAADNIYSAGGELADSEDVETGVRWMIEQGFVDPHRVAIFGHSAGGPRVDLILMRSKLFAAAILHDPIPPPGSLTQISMTSGTSTGGKLLTFFNKTPIEQAPQTYGGGVLFDGYKITTPTLIIVGNPEKGAVDPLSSEILFSMLRAGRVPVRLLRYPDDGHIPSGINSALHQYKQLSDWLARYAPA